MASLSLRCLGLGLITALVLHESKVLAAVTAEPWDPQKHVRYEHLVAPRTKRRIPRHLVPRQTSDQTVQPGQPTHTIPDDLVGGFEIVGDSGVSAQQMFLGSENLVGLLDPASHGSVGIPEMLIMNIRYNSRSIY
jgi:hypothetical protein